MARLFAIVLVGSLLLAQSRDEPVQAPPPFRVSTDLVVAPVTVFDRSGNYVNGIQPEQFHLFDNDKEQNIHVDIAYQPISLVIAVQANAQVQSILPQVQKIGNLITPLVIGDQGEAAVVAYDSRIRKLQDFTSDPEKITRAVKSIMPGSRSNRLIDAVVDSGRLLDSRPPNRRRILLLIGETRDLSSESRAREALIGLQLANIVFYAVDMSRVVSTLTAPAEPARPIQQPAAAYPLPGGNPSTPTTVNQTFGLNERAQFLPLMIELFKDVKAIFKDNPVELFTKGTGGSEFSFTRQRGLEEAISKIGEELHSQYLISYNPNNKEEGGFHHITVAVGGRPEVARVQTRLGYWLAAKYN
ncbi:MAG TPA: VWA domain-containing protein [Bryobacteraceae bacterium]|jgi:VWFA-related protein